MIANPYFLLKSMKFIVFFPTIIISSKHGAFLDFLYSLLLGEYTLVIEGNLPLSSDKERK